MMNRDSWAIGSMEVDCGGAFFEIALGLEVSEFFGCWGRVLLILLIFVMNLW